MRTHCKTYHRGELRWQKQREIDFLKKLDGVPHFPDLIAVDPEGIYITYCGEQLTPEDIDDATLASIKQQFDESLSALEHAGITHRDITIHNVMWQDGVLSIVDFGWSVWDSEEDTPHPTPHVMKPWFSVPDREQVRQLIERLEGWMQG